MLAPNGNIFEVYRQTERNRMRNEKRKIKRHAEKQINQVAARTPSFDCELADEDATGRWYLVQTKPGQDMLALRWLARRRFAVVRPMQQRMEPRFEGQSIGGMEPVFPGYLFVYVWDIDKLHDRICAAPGVDGLLRLRGSLKPAVIDDRFMYILRNLSWAVNPNMGRTAHEIARQEVRHELQRNGTRRPTRQERKRIARMREAVESDTQAMDRLNMGMANWGITFENQSTWELISRLEPHERIALLTWTLLPPVAG